MSPIVHLESLSELGQRYSMVACDVWGVVHNGVRPYEDAVAALAAFRAGGGTVLLLTNAPRPNTATIEHLDQIGVDHDAYDGVVTSGDVTLDMLAELNGAPIYFIGDQTRDHPLVSSAALNLTGPEEAEHILCTGLFNDNEETPDDYRERLGELAKRGLRMICANPDIVVDKGDQRLYCAGSLARLYEQLGGHAVYAGKPYAPVYEMTLKRFSALSGAPAKPEEILVIGDGINTDIKGALGAGWDVLFIAGGIHAAEAEHPDGLAGLFAGLPGLPVAWQQRLK
ncbi:MAG: TIGR01459 family HAD-type hydrolase [Hyphomicrobiales bacterium]|nr:MAG: TIGR01459 family HAD-type hydrolase [Hyphomicrobiales bacterium]